MNFNFNTISNVIEGVFTLEEAKAALLKEDHNIQYQLLSSTDWTVTRLQETGTAIPTNINNYRTSVRTAGNLRKSKINNCSSLDTLKALLLLSSSNRGENGLPVINENALPDWPTEVN